MDEQRLYHRRSIRLHSYDYSQAGAYFVTVCVEGRTSLFGAVTADGAMRPNDAGRMVLAQWHALARRYPMIALDAFVVMPNHIHGIVWITNDAIYPPADHWPIVGAGLLPAHNPAIHEVDDDRATSNDRATTTVTPALGEVIGAFKSLTTVEYGRSVRGTGWRTYRRRLWQRNYYEHVIRNDAELGRIRTYIQGNPVQWPFDPDNPEAIKAESRDAWQE